MSYKIIIFTTIVAVITCFGFLAPGHPPCVQEGNCYDNNIPVLWNKDVVEAWNL